jgi:hypothetical protein
MYVSQVAVIRGVSVTMAWYVLRLQMEEWAPIWRVAVNILNKQSWTADKRWSSSLGVGVVLTNPHHKTGLVMKQIPVPWSWTDPLWEDKIKMDLQEVGWGGMD